MKLSKTPPINQACQGIDFPSSLPSSLSLPAVPNSETSEVSTNTVGGVKDGGPTLGSLAFPQKRASLRHCRHAVAPPFPRMGPPAPTPTPPTPTLYGRHDFPRNEIFTGHWFPEK